MDFIIESHILISYFLGGVLHAFKPTAKPEALAATGTREATEGAMAEAAGEEERLTPRGSIDVELEMDMKAAGDIDHIFHNIDVENPGEAAAAAAGAGARRAARGDL